MRGIVGRNKRISLSVRMFKKCDVAMSKSTLLVTFQMRLLLLGNLACEFRSVDSHLSKVLYSVVQKSVVHKVPVE